MTSLLTGLALCFPLHHSNSPSLDVSLSPVVPLTQHPPPPPHPSTAFPYYTHLLGRDTASRAYIDAPMHSHARVARSRTFTQPRIEHRLPALTGRVQWSLGSHRLALSHPGRSAWSLPLPPPPSLTLSPSFSPFYTRALAPSIATSLAPLVTTDTSYLVLSLPASRPFLLSSFPPFLPPIDSSCFCAFPPCSFFATRSLLCRYS